MNLLIFEFATAQGLQDPSLSLEGVGMLEGLLSDLYDTDANYLIRKNSTISPKVGKNSSCTPLKIEEDLLTWLDDNIAPYQSCLPLAPEEDFILYNLTKKIENKGVTVIGSASEAVLTCSDKLRTYNLLKEDHPLITTKKVDFNSLKEYKNVFNVPQKMVVKPADGVSCSGVCVVQSYPEFLKASLEIKKITNLPYFLLQDYVEGISTSVSLLSDGNSAVPLSLNLQNIEFNKSKFNMSKINYNGGKAPFEHELSEEAKKIAQNAVESVDGLKGYVGVDLILGDQVYIVEINPRITTPYVALRSILNFNLGKSIINAVNGELPLNIILDGDVAFQKEKNGLKIQKGV